MPNIIQRRDLLGSNAPVCHGAPRGVSSWQCGNYGEIVNAGQKSLEK